MPGPVSPLDPDDIAAAIELAAFLDLLNMPRGMRIRGNPAGPRPPEALSVTELVPPGPSPGTRFLLIQVRPDRS